MPHRIDLPILEISHIRLDKTACFAPYVDVAIWEFCKGESSAFKARLDTGADTTVVPESIAKPLMPLPLGRPVLLRFGDGKVKRTRTYMVTVNIIGFKAFRPERGVILCDGEAGLIGMDILRDLHLEMCNEKTVLSFPEKGGGK